MIDCLVFSKDRALQLNGFLQTVHMAPYDAVGVLWTASDDRYRQGYGRVRWPQMVEEDVFEIDVRRWLAHGTSEHVVFHTDDDLFFRRPPSPLPLVPGVVSLRLGMNTQRCFMNGETNELDHDPLISGAWLYWDWRFASNDYAYPHSINGHIFRREDVTLMLDADVRFANPTELELVLAARVSSAQTLIAAPYESCVVSTPWNRVAASSNNWASDDPELAAGALNDRWLDGWALDPFRMDFSGVDSPHALIAPVFQRL